MSLKGIELQIAIPKTFDAGKIAEQKHQQTQLNLDHANALTEKQTLMSRESVTELEDSAKTSADGQHNEQSQLTDVERQQNEEEEKTVHPYKGSFVDFIG